MLPKEWLLSFLSESFAIEGIHREPSQREVVATMGFLELSAPAVHDVETLVNVYQPGARLRRKAGMNVIVGGHRPPTGGHRVEVELTALLIAAPEVHPFRIHCSYETLHPFVDGNGRSGRTLWLWGMVRGVCGAQLIEGRSFLDQWYRQSLAFSR